MVTKLLNSNKIFFIIPIVVLNSCLNNQVIFGSQKRLIISHSALNKQLIDTALINRINERAFSYRKIFPDSALLLANKALSYSKEIHYEKGIGDAYIALGYTHLINFSKNDSAKIYITKAYDIFKTIDDKKGMGLSYFGLGYVYSFKGNMKKAKEYSLKSLEYYSSVADKRGMYNASQSLSYIYKQFKEYNKSFEFVYKAIDYSKDLADTALIADAFNSLGNIFKDQGLFEHAIDNYFEALKLWELKADSSGMAIAYGSIANMYYFQQNHKKALEYYKLKLPIILKFKNDWEVTKTYNSIAGIYNSTGKHELALEYQKKSLQINYFMNYAVGIADSYYKLANTYYLMGILDSASVYVDKSLELSQNIDIPAALANYFILKGKIEFIRKNSQLALKNAMYGYKIGKELNIPFVISDASDLLRGIYASSGQYDLAYKYLLEFKQMQDSINKEENVKKITRLEVQYEFDKKKQIIELENEKERKKYEEEMKRQRIYLLSSILVILLTIISVVFIIKQKNTKAKYQTIALEQKLLRMQMNPHFIFNSLCAIQDYALDNKSNEVVSFLSKFAGLMRSILENSKNDFVLLETEINTLKNYLEIQKLRFDADFDYLIEIAPSIDKSTYTIPPMMVQPFIENSVEHGLLPKKDKGKIEINFSLENDLITIELKDNGIGRKESFLLKTEKQKSKQSLATIITKERIAFLKKTINKNCRFQIIDNYIDKGTGTCVMITVPFKIALPD